MSENDSININKGDLWKYSTFILIAVVVIVGIIMLTNNSSTGNVVNTGNQGDTGNADTSIITDNPSIFPSLGPENAEHVVIEFSVWRFNWLCWKN